MDSKIVFAVVGVVGLLVALRFWRTGVIDTIWPNLMENLQELKDLIPEESFMPKVKVYSVVTGKTFGAHQVLLDKVKNVETTRDLQESHVVIVFCPITSRVGSDVEAAMTDIKGSYGQKPVILVLMHHTRDVDYSTDGKRWSDVYDNVVLDVHVLFHETERGLLTCPKNHQAVDQIQKELQKHGDAGTGSQADKASQTDFQHPEHKLDTSSPRHPDEGNSIPSASTGDEQESSDKKDSGQQSSDDGAKTQADMSSQKDPQNPEHAQDTSSPRHPDEGNSIPSASTGDEQESSDKKDSGQQSSDDGAKTQADTSSQKDPQNPEHAQDTSSPRHPEEGSSIPSASTGDEQESSDKKESGQQSSDDGAKTQEI